MLGDAQNGGSQIACMSQGIQHPWKSGIPRVKFPRELGIPASPSLTRDLAPPIERSTQVAKVCVLDRRKMGNTGRMGEGYFIHYKLLELPAFTTFVKLKCMANTSLIILCSECVIGCP